VAFAGIRAPEESVQSTCARRERMSRGLPRSALAQRLGIKIEEGRNVSPKSLAKVCVELALSEYGNHEAGGH
jgi:hypothetical protein